MAATTTVKVVDVRALQTKTTTKSDATSTSAGSAGDSGATELPSRAGSGFPLKGAPPFILALLAVGIFVVGMIIFFGSRRRAAAQRDRSMSLSPGFDMPPPKLWDIWSPPEQPPEVDTGQWKNMQPLSATVWDDTPKLAAAPVALNHGNVLPHRNTILAAAFSHLRRRYLRPQLEDNLVRMDEKLARVIRLQIAVAIAMPSLDSSSSEPAQQSNYVIGLHESPWGTN